VPADAGLPAVPGSPWPAITPLPPGPEDQQHPEHKLPRLAPHDPFPLPEGGGSPDLRAFIQALEDTGRLTRVRERVDWRLGIGRWTRSRHKPLLFEDIREYSDQRIFTNGLIDRSCIALALGLDAELPPSRVITEARKRLRDPIPPKLVRGGPVMENVIPESALELFQFPVPRWSEHDGGRYLGTWHLNISKDPETGQRSAGMYRMKVLGPKQATVSAPRRSDLANHLARAEEKKTELPMAVVIGAPEPTVIAARAACPEGMDAFDLAGALQQQPVELIDCGRLEVPANAEIVIEGFIHLEARVEDGPYFTYSGQPKSNPQAFLFEATRVLHRDQPIFRGSTLGRPGGEDYQVQTFLGQLKLLESQRSRWRRMVNSLFG
jgi:4-hydroxy-3-polyprenylbenzoate decarboxylase